MFSILWLGSIIATVYVADRKNLSIGLFLFLSICFGPLGLVIALLVSGKTKDPLPLRGVYSFQEAEREIHYLRQMLLSLQQRLSSLEESVKNFKPEGGGSLPAAEEHIQSISAAIPEASAKTLQENFELKFGKYWLSRVGVALFVLGVGFFISYTFQYLNAFFKIAVGYLLSAAFFFWGNFLEKKERYVKVAWGILGGAWGLLYLSTYAMHYIDATRLVASPTAAIMLLTIVSAAAVAYNLKYKSWIVTSLTYSLAFLTVGLGDQNYSTVIYWSLLTASIAFIAYKQRWVYLLLLGIIGCYFTGFTWGDLYWGSFYWSNSPRIISPDDFKINFSMLALSWAIFTVSLLRFKSEDKDELRYIMAGNLLNTGCFAALGSDQIYGAFASHGERDPQFWFLIVLAALELFVAYGYKFFKQPRSILVNCCLSFSLLAAAVFIKFPELSIAFFWTLEAAMILGLGIYYREYVYRAAALFLNFMIALRLFVFDLMSDKYYVILGYEISHKILIFSFVALFFYVIGVWIKMEKVEKLLTPDESFLYRAYPVMATVLLVFLLGNEVKDKWLTLSWGLLGITLIGIGFGLKDRIFRLCALGVLSLSFFHLVFFDLMSMTTIYKIVAFICLGAMLVVISLIYSRFKLKK